MDTQLMHQGSIGLNLGEMLRLRDAGGRYIGVVAGAVWITQEDDAHDHILRAGEHFQFDRGGLALVWAIDGTARLVLENGLLTERKAEAQVISVTRQARLAHSPDFERRARELRAEAMAQAFSTVADGLAKLWGRVGSAMSEAIRALQTARKLPALSDSTLKDIGLHRDQINCIANPRLC